jgi:GT2 family glycosyltransferase
MHTALVVLSYNGLETTRRFMEHFDANTNQDDVLLVFVDNGSSDGSAEYLEEQSRKRNNMVYSASDTNLGVIGGRNHGFDIYKTLQNKPEYIMFLDNDQYVQHGWLDQHHAVLKGTNAAVVGVEAWLMNERHYPVRQAKRPNDPWTYVGCGGMLMKGSIPEKLGMFDDRFNPAYFEDPDFNFRVMEDGGRPAWNFKARIVHLPHQTLGKNSKKMEIFKDSYMKFCDKWGKKRFRPRRQDLIEALRQ